MEKPQPDQSAVRARLEFPIWHKSFTKAYAAWANAPSDLKTPLLLQGQALAKAESWLLACPDKLSESQKRFIIRSISQRARGPQDGPTPVAAGGQARRWIWRRTSDRSLWSLYAVIGLGLWFFSPDIIRDVMERALNPPDIYQDLAKGRPAPKPTSSPDTTAAGPQEPVAVAGLPETSLAPLGEIDETPPIYVPLKPPASRAARLAELSETKLMAGQSRVALLLALEAADLATDAANPDRAAADRITDVLVQAMAANEQLGPLAVRSATARTTFFCDDARALIAIAGDDRLAVWPQSGTRRSASHAVSVATLDGAAADRDCRRVLVPNEDFNVEVLPLSGGAPLAVLHGHESHVTMSSFSPDGSAIVTASTDSTARIWSARNGQLRHLLSGHDWHVLSAEFSPDGRRVLTGSADMTARLWDAASGRQLQVFKDHQGVVTSARFSADGSRVLTSSWDGFARLWDAETGRLQLKLKQPDGIVTLEADRDVQRIATSQNDGALQLWDALSGDLLVSHPGVGAAVRDLRFTPAGNWLIVLSWNGRLDIYDGRTGLHARALAAGDKQIRAIRLGSGARTLAAITEKGERITWPLPPSLAAATSAARSIAQPCLTADERALLGLELDQPGWCSSIRPRDAALP